MITKTYHVLVEKFSNVISAGSKIFIIELNYITVSKEISNGKSVLIETWTIYFFKFLLQ